MKKEKEKTDKNKYEPQLIPDFDFNEYFKNHGKTVYTITYPDGKVGKLNRGAVILL